MKNNCRSCGQCCVFCACLPFRLNGLVNYVTYPAPDEPLEEYQLSLLSRKELVWLRLKEFSYCGTEIKGNIKPKNLVPALYVKAEKPSEFTVIYSHGNAEDISQEGPYLQEFVKDTGCDILCYEYPGYSLTNYLGDNHTFRNRPSERKICQAAEAAWRFLVDDQKVDPKKIILYGRSIGSGPAVYLASRTKIPGTINPIPPNECAGVFLISPIQSTIRAVMHPCIANCCFCYDAFPNFQRIGHVNTYVAIMHAKDDEVVKFKNGQVLAKNMKFKDFGPLWLERGGHNDIQYETIIEHFKTFTNFLHGQTNLKYSAQVIRDNRIKKLEAPLINEQLPITIKPYPSDHIPTATDRPALREFDRAMKMLIKIIPADGKESTAARSTPVSKEEMRQKRIAVLNNMKKTELSSKVELSSG